MRGGRRPEGSSARESRQEARRQRAGRREVHGLPQERAFCTLLTPASALACPLPRCWDLDNSSPYWWIIKGPIVLSVGVSPWGQCPLLYSTSLPGSTEGPYTAGKLTPGWYSGRLSFSVVLPQTL